MPVVNKELCTGCWSCIPYCPVSALKKNKDETMTYVDQDICTKCNVCIRNKVCPFEAIEEQPYDDFQSEFQHIMSDPTATIAGSDVPGRGTEEMKTNDVTGRFKKNEFGICIDMGRPGIGCKLREAEKVAMAVVKAGVKLEGPEVTPLAKIMTDLKTGKLRDDLLDTNVLSIIIEGKCSIENMADVLKALKKVEKQIDTVFCLGIVARVDEKVDTPLYNILKKLNIPKPFRGKINVGLGRPLVED